MKINQNQSAFPPHAPMITVFMSCKLISLIHKKKKINAKNNSTVIDIVALDNAYKYS